MVENLCKSFGRKIGQIQGQNGGKTTEFYSFPSVDDLSRNPASVEAELRKLGFGYRAKYVAKTASALRQLGAEEYLFRLRKLPYSAARKELLTFPGVGPKVADCVLLMSLDKAESIPVDTHMFQIATENYLTLSHLKKKHKSVTSEKVYKEIADHFRGLFGPFAGWAHSVLFSADLKHFQSLKEKKNSVSAGVKKKRKTSE